MRSKKGRIRMERLLHTMICIRDSPHITVKEIVHETGSVDMTIRAHIAVLLHMDLIYVSAQKGKARCYSFRETVQPSTNNSHAPRIL